MLAGTLVGCVVVARAARRRPDAAATLLLARALAALLIVNEVAIRVVLLAQGNWDWATDLPLQLSDFALVAAAIALWTPRPPALAYELTYFWTFTATVMALATPDLRQGPDHYFFWAFFIAHSGVLVAASYLTWGRRLTLRPGAVWRALGATAVVAAVAGTANFLTGGNYMFLRETPPAGSLLDLMGPWPWYLVSTAVLTLALFAILYRLRGADPAGAWRRLGGLTNSGSPRAALAWALYDFANTIFSFAIVSFAMSLWAIRFLGEGVGILWFTIAVSASVLVNAAVSPVLGAMSDRIGRRKPFLAVFTAIMVIATALIGFVPVAFGLVLFAIANFAFQASLIYQDALLPTVARPEARGRLSGIGAALGYVGAIVAGLSFNLTVDDDGQTTAVSFLVVAGLVMLFALPVFLVVPEHAKRAERLEWAETLRRPWRVTFAAFRRARATPGLLRFIVGRFFYNDPVSTTIAVMSAFAVTAVGLSQGEALNILLVLIVIAAVASYGWGRLADRIGPKRTLLIVLTLWAIGLTLLAGFLATVPFLLAGAILGAGVGGTAVVDRVLLVRLAKPEEVGQMLGIFGLAGKSSGVAGPLIYGATVAVLLEPLGRGAFQVAVVALTVPLVVGYLIVRRLPETEPIVGTEVRPRRRLRARPGGGVTVGRAGLAALAVLVALGSGWALLQTTAATGVGALTVLRPPIAGLALEVQAGDIAVDASEQPGLAVASRLRYFLVRPELTTDRDGGRVELRYGCRWWTSCEIDLDVEAPVAADLSAVTAFGDVRVRGASGDLELETRAGEISALDLRSGRVRAQTTSGELRLAFATPPSDVDVETTTGGVDILLPVGPYRIEADSVAGDVRLEGIADTPSAVRRVRVNTSSGDVVIRVSRG